MVNSDHNTAKNPFWLGVHKRMEGAGMNPNPETDLFSALRCKTLCYWESASAFEFWDGSAGKLDGGREPAVFGNGRGTGFTVTWLGGAWSHHVCACS